MTAHFALCGPHGTLVAHDVEAAYDDVDAAIAALRDGAAAMVVGALPFDMRRPAALMTPASITDQLPQEPTTGLPQVHIADTLPGTDEHRTRIKAALSRLRDTDDPLEKVVLARTLRLRSDAPMNPWLILRRLRDADPEATAYLSDLSAAGSHFAGTVLVGASPELLVARRGDQVICQPFAGSAPRSADRHTDDANGAALAASGKNRHEHQLVVDTMHDVLKGVCATLDIATEPQLSRTATVWHLSTPIRGTLRDTSTTALDLAVALHPTPAVGGVPTAEAVDLIAALERDRGFYAGAVGWCDARGDGRWVVAIRGAQLSAGRCEALASAGGGIVAESDADDEVEETTAKFNTILNALGAS